LIRLKEDSEEFTDRELTKNILEKYLNAIDLKYREVLVLYFFEDMDYKEIAEVLEIPISTVGVRISRGKAKLKELIGDKDL
jgi:RNA polymerase sigma-70 factor (ECF subfamily)